MKNTKKKKRSSGPKSTCKDVAGRDEKKGGGGGGVVEVEEEKERKAMEALVGEFSFYSLEDAALAYRDAESDPEKAAETLRRALIDNAKDPSTCSTSSGVSGSDFASTSGSFEGFMEFNCDRDVTRCINGFKRGKQKKVVAATGTVSTVLGKGYVKRNPTRPKGYNNGIVEKEDAEQFLCSMLGNDCDLSMAVVRDVLCQCGYNIEQALDVLLDLSACSYEPSENDRHHNDTAGNIDDMKFLIEHNDNLTDRRLECTSLSFEGELPDNLRSQGSVCRNYVEVLSSSAAHSPISSGNIKSNLPQKVLESLFNIPRSSEHDKDTMNWRNIVKKMQSLGPEFDIFPCVAEPQQHTFAKGDEYHVFREDANQQWGSVRSYYQKAATAYTKGDQAYAAFLSDQAKEQTKLAQKADVKASHDIFIARNKGIENVITIDLHGQHVKPAMKMLKLHLLFGSYVPSVQTLRVITGCGSHGMGKSKLKQSVIKLLEKEAIEWSEENRGTVLIKLNGYRAFSFLDSDSDGESD